MIDVVDYIAQIIVEKLMEIETSIHSCHVVPFATAATMNNNNNTSQQEQEEQNEKEIDEHEQYLLLEEKEGLFKLLNDMNEFVEKHNKGHCDFELTNVTLLNECCATLKK